MPRRVAQRAQAGSLGVWRGGVLRSTSCDADQAPARVYGRHTLACRIRDYSGGNDPCGGYPSCICFAASPARLERGYIPTGDSAQRLVMKNVVGRVLKHDRVEQVWAIVSR